MYLYSLLKGSLAGIASVGRLLVLRSHFALVNAMHDFFLPAFETRGSPLSVITRLQIPQPHLFPLTDDPFTGRPRILMLFDGRRERWHGILLKVHFKLEGRSKLPAGTICLITMGERTREGQGKSKCFVFVTDKAVTNTKQLSQLFQGTWETG